MSNFRLVLLPSALVLLVTCWDGVGAIDNDVSSRQSVSRGAKFLKDHAEEWVPWAKGLLNERKPGQPDFNIPCSICLGTAMALIEDYLEQGVTLQQIIDAIVPLCATYVYDEDVCRGLLEINLPTLFWVVENNRDLDITRFCVEGVGSKCEEHVIDGEAWLVEMPDVPKPPVDRPTVPEGTPSLKILHLGDIHLDMQYEEGTEADCNKIICCQGKDGPAENEAAGAFGSYHKCDTPQNLLDNALTHIVETHQDIDMIFFTGDMPAHDIWAQSVEANSATIAQAMSTLKKYFGDSSVFINFGNHEPHPLNVFSFEGLNAPEEFLTDYIYENAWSHWSHWLPSDQEANVKKTGQWSVSPREGLRIIGFNNMYSYRTNWFVWMDLPDPNGQLAWLANELQMAEDNGEHVYLMSHIPPGNHNSIPVWSHNFNRIVNRYENIIRGQFYGHTHVDEFSVFYNEDAVPSNVAFIGSSITSWQDLNPGYKIFYVDGLRGAESTWTVMDMESWILDLELANESGETAWRTLYSSFKDAFAMGDLSPASFDVLGRSFKDDDDKFDLYRRFYWKDSPRAPYCLLDCRDEHVCDVLSSDTSDNSNCQ